MVENDNEVIGIEQVDSNSNIKGISQNGEILEVMKLDLGLDVNELCKLERILERERLDYFVEFIVSQSLLGRGNSGYAFLLISLFNEKLLNNEQIKKIMEYIEGLDKNDINDTWKKVYGLLLVYGDLSETEFIKKITDIGFVGKEEGIDIEILDVIINNPDISNDTIDTLFEKYYCQKSLNTLVINKLINTGKVTKKKLTQLASEILTFEFLKILSYKETLELITKHGGIEKSFIRQFINNPEQYYNELGCIFPSMMDEGLITDEQIENIFWFSVNKKNYDKSQHFSFWEDNIEIKVLKSGLIDEEKIKELFNDMESGKISICRHSKLYVEIIRMGIIDAEKLDKNFDKITTAVLSIGSGIYRDIFVALMESGKIDLNKIRDLYNKIEKTRSENIDINLYVIPPIIGSGALDKQTIHTIYKKIIYSNSDLSLYRESLGFIFQSIDMENENLTLLTDFLRLIIVSDQLVVIPIGDFIVNSSNISDENLGKLFDNLISEFGFDVENSNMYKLLSSFVKSGRLGKDRMDFVFKQIVKKISEKENDYKILEILNLLIISGEVSFFRNGEKYKNTKIPESLQESYNIFKEILKNSDLKDLNYFGRLSIMLFDKQKLSEELERVKGNK